MKSAARHRDLSVGEAEQFAATIRARGGTVVFTNGVFDLLHPGHARYLRDARRLGDALMVGVNSDRSVRLNKGPGRPLTPAAERAEVLRALECVDATVIFDEVTPLALIGRVLPDVLVKGADWGPDNVAGRDIVEGRGGRVVRMDLTPGLSTTEILRRVNAR